MAYEDKNPNTRDRDDHKDKDFMAYEDKNPIVNLIGYPQ